MDIYPVMIVSLLLLLSAVGLIISHVHSWHASLQKQLEADEFDYRRRQFKRRMQTSTMLGVLAIAMAVGYVLTLWLRSDMFNGIFWMAMMALACWVALLALMDIWATKHHFGRLRQDYVVEQAKLQAEIRRIQSVRGNGKAAGGAGRGAGERKSEVEE
jgi:hypothetical protein